jgi:hypothetical protein
VFSAVAIAGFQAASNQQFYSLVVDTVIFSNGNTQLNLTMNYLYNNNGINFQSSWSSIKLSWLAVSTLFETIVDSDPLGGSYIWAGTVGLYPPFSGVSGAIMTNSPFIPQTTAMQADAKCGFINSSPGYFDLYCSGAANPVFETHAYIMGFQFNPAGTYTLAASALQGNGGTALTDTNEALTTSSFVYVDAAAGTASLPLTGPKILVQGFNGQLQYVKIAIVITTILDIATYPTGNTAQFEYSGIFMNYTLFNQPNPLQQAATAAAGSQNYNYFSLLHAQYQIYGLSAFQIAALPSNVTVVNYDLSFADINTIVLKSDDVNYISNVHISGDRWNSLINSCSATTTTMYNIQQKSLTTVPTLQVGQQSIFEASSNLDFVYTAAPIGDPTQPLSSSITFTNSLYFENFTAGMAYQLAWTITNHNDAAVAPALANGYSVANNVQYVISIQGNQIVNKVEAVTLVAGTNDVWTESIGYIFTSATPVVSITLNVPRDAVNNLKFETNLVVTQYSNAYDPIADCCVQFCPANSGVNILSTPPTCISCTLGLVYNSVTGQCQCQTGYYSVVQATGQSVGSKQCYPCFAPLCQTCQQATPTVCDSCVAGAAVNTANLCACLSGYYQAGALCNACPHQCLTCSVATVCNSCSDNSTRDSTQNCACITGFYDSGSAVCSKCSALCLTCNSSTTCTSCVTANNRTLVNGQCVCATGFYQIVNPDGSLTCGACDASCTQCSLLPTLCSNCDPNANRILGFDALGNQVCNCLPGFAQNSNGACVQSNCNADPYCSNCQVVLTNSICIRCVASTNRVLVLPSQKCLCQQGFFDLNGICTSCAPGCASCTSATTCSQCVASATSNNDGSCKCGNGYYFLATPIRYCTVCPSYCTSCTAANACTSCKPNFALVNGACTCPTGRFVDANGQCSPCVNGCQACNSTTSCTLCNTPLLLQDTGCVTRCGPGYYQSGFTCLKCSAGCAACSTANVCTFCQAGQLAYNGFCYVNCPSGSVASLNTSSCVTCNSPCGTCTEHPSKCTSCSSCCGSLFNFQCLTSCPVGTYSINGTCQYCSYSCATCIGTNSTCTSCPSGKVLYNGFCYDTCPYVMIGGICTFNCAKGLYKTPINQCVACDSTCATCDVVAKNCTSCASGFALNGTCVKTCPLNYFGLNGLCQPCNAECNGCLNTCSNCINCAAGYYKCGSLCVKTCNPNQFPDYSSSTCITCNSKCKTCSSQQFCTTCANPQAVPVNGVCNDCSYPCNTCGTAPSICTTCVSGFNLVGSTCIAACPTGASPVNGVCQCANGYIYSNQCVASCPTGYGNVGGQCTQCASNCAACSGSTTSCTSCINGYALNSVTGVCQIAPNCQLGQYFSQSSNSCTSICPTGTFYYESVCLTACLQGYQDNGVGGCVAVSAQNGCSYPYYLSNGVCISNCPASTYADSNSRVCKSCSSNCFSCLTNTFCYACNAGYDLTNGVCITSTVTCPSGQFRYNGVCYTTCPVGSCAQGNFCQRVCPAGSWSYNNGCYRTCPTQYTTNDACVSSCPAGTALQNGVCQVGSQSCPSGQYFDSGSSSCKACQYPCSQCSLTASYCTACATGLTLNQNLCVSSSTACGSKYYQDVNRQCQPCPSKCATCLSATACSTCSQGYSFNGYDCVVVTAQLQKVTISVKSVSRRDNVAFITVGLNIIPNGLSPSQKNAFFLVVPNTGDKVSYVNQWQSDANDVIVAVTYATFPTQTAVFLSVNAQQLASSYSSIGYTADASSFVSAAVNIGLATAPASLTIPATSSYNKANPGSDVSAITQHAANLNGISLA